MASMLLRGLDPDLIQSIEREASRRGVSVDRLIAEALAECFADHSMRRFDDLDALAKTWSTADLREFERAIEPLTKVDDQLWGQPRK